MKKHRMCNTCAIHEALGHCTYLDRSDVVCPDIEVYEEGAKAQLEIDIKKAQDFMCEHCNDKFDCETSDGEHFIISGFIRCTNRMLLRKAMEK